jgi:hypothetical protein
MTFVLHYRSQHKDTGKAGKLQVCRCRGRYAGMEWIRQVYKDRVCKAKVCKTTLLWQGKAIIVYQSLAYLAVAKMALP